MSDQADGRESEQEKKFRNFFFMADNENLESRSAKSAPSKVFLNHFTAIALHIERDTSRFRLKEIEFFKHKIQRLKDYDQKRVTELLRNSWSTEYLLRQNTRSQNPDYLKIALHWAFPQAYYCTYLNMLAFFTAKGVICKTHEALIKQFASLVRNDAYPECVSFYADGERKNYRYLKLPSFDASNKKSALEKAHSSEDIAAQIATFLRTTRDKKADELKADRQGRKKTAIKNKNGDVLQNFRPEHWKQITDRIGITTIFDLLYRLRIKANYQDVGAFLYADLNFSYFHKQLYSVVEYLNLVHEAYTARVIGIANYERIVREFPKLSGDDFVERRMEKYIIPLFGKKR